MEKSTEDILRTGNVKAKEPYSMQMGVNIREILRMILLMVLVKCITLMVIFMKESGRTVRSKEEENINLLMGVFMLVIGEKMRRMDLGK